MENKIRIQDDLYENINGEWLASAVIPDDRPTTGGFALIDMAVEKTMMDDFRAFAAGEKQTDIPEVEQAVKLYRKVLDTERRNSEGIRPLLPLLHKIAGIDSIDKLNEQAGELLRNGVSLPVTCGVDADWKNATANAVLMTGPSTILPDTSYYGTQPGAQMMEVYRMMAAKALSFTDLGEEEQKQYLEDAVAFDALVAQKVKSQLEWAEYVKCYNPMPVDEVAEYVKPLDLRKIMGQLWQEIPDKIIVYDPKAIREMSFYFNEENLDKYIHWAYINALLANLPYLSEEMASTATIFRRALMGIQSDPVLEKQAYQMASRYFSEPVGVYYGRTYFGEEAKKDIVELVKKIIAAYIKRMEVNTFLKEATREKAIAKLNAITIKMGYPDAVRKFYSTLKVNDEDTYFDAVHAIQTANFEDEISQLHEPVDRNRWAMPGHMVNACYDPFRNDITFPAAILQKPFYALAQTVSENLGGIGAVIAHEISHAFDNNGAHFDEHGNLADWWAKEDFEAFENLTKAMIEEWDGIEYCGETLNGQMVVSENIADNGGMAVTIQIMHETEGTDFHEYFINWARIWCLKAKEEYMKLLMKNDVHSPAKLRANIQVRNFSEWYEAFNVTEKDQMYIAPEKRVIIW